LPRRGRDGNTVVMSVALASPDDAPAKPPEPAWREFARAPLVPVALAATAGLVADRYGDIPAAAGWVVGLVGLVVWFVARSRGAASAVAWLWVAAGGLAAAHHHAHLHSFAPDDISTFAPDVPTPVRLRGTLAEEPTRTHEPKYDPLVTEQRHATTSTVLDVTAVETHDGWAPASGRVRVTVEGTLGELHAADLVEISGRLARPHTPSNPGERDYRAFLLDDRITADLRVKKSADPVTRLEEGWRTSLFGVLGVARGWGTRSLKESLPSDESGLAAALLLGDNAALDREGWDAYVRTGVVHVLAISGQHLVILAAFVWVVLKAFGVRRRNGAWIVMAVMIGYTLLTGARPSAVRAAVMVCAVCLALVFRRPIIPANIFALAWLVVIALNPADAFSQGCQLSFLSVFVLIWGAARWLAPRPLTPVEQLLEESRTPTEKFLRGVLRAVWVAFAISFILGVANAPLILAWQNLVSLLGLVLGPPLVLLTSIALVAGFLLLLVSPLGVVAWPLARVTEWSLAGCEVLVHAAEQVPGGWVYAPAPSMLWLVGFYLGVAGLVLLPPQWPKRFFVGLAVWVLVGLLVSYRPRTSDELRVTFLAVGHGGCVVIETPDGRVILYDAGTTTGPDAVRRVIAPFLWHRGVSRIDEVFLSHADLDHFNGLPELLKRFPVGRVTHTPTFPDKSTPGVGAALAALDRRGVARRVAVVGERFEAGGVTFDVLHPPAEGPGKPENENPRSMVLLVRYEGHTVLLTGDLEGEGQEQVRLRPVPPVDAMLAPHHGGKLANYPLPGPAGTRLPGPMATWAKPKLVISSQRPGPTDHLAATYTGVGATVWDTPTAGAVTVRCHTTGVVAEAFRSGEVRVVTRGR
jgi:competence protein ComEC